MVSAAGTTYFLLMIGLGTAMIFLNHKILKITNLYWFWMAIAIVCFLWVFANRFVPDWIDYWKNHKAIYGDPTTMDNSKTISRAFMLDACPCFFSMLMISLIADPSRRVARILAPIALIGGLISLGTIITDNNIDTENARWSAEYIFFGIGKERCYFIMHWCQFMVACGVLLNTPTSGWRVWLSSLGSFFVYLGYVGIVMAITKCSWFCTGLALNDYSSPNGEYHIVADAFGLKPGHYLPCPFILITILSAMGLLVGGVAHDYVFTSKWIWKYGNTRTNDWTRPYDYKNFGNPNRAWW
ncbi:MAG: DUF5378 family protein [Mycoplasmoidaceae bacterium]